MIRLAWRQSRLTAACAGILLVALTIVLLLTEHAMTGYMHTSGLGDCLAARGQCTLAQDAFVGRYGAVFSLVSALSFIPMLVGLFWAAPLIAREVEQGTHHLVWTQSISPRRWLAVKLGMLIVGALLVAVVITGLFTWWSRPWTMLSVEGNGYSRINPSLYNLQGVVPIADMLFAFALGTAAGALVRRTVPAMAVTLVGYLGVRLGLQSLRANGFLPAKVVAFPFGTQDPRAAMGDWFLGQSVVDQHGHPVSLATLQALCPASATASGPRGTSTPCVIAHGYHFQDVVQPLSRFWSLQGIESSILLTAAALLLAVATWWTLRRTT
jgi:hypothetical protein